MAKTHIIGTGLQGLIGSQLTELLQDRYEFTNLSRSTGVDITNKEQVFVAITGSETPYVLHLAAKADVDGCEHDKVQGEKGEAWQINVEGTRNLLEACKRAGKMLIYISTDFVFDGKKDTGAEGYSESDTPAPLNWYAETKYRAEQLIRQTDVPYLILRPAYPYGRPHEKKKDFVQAIATRLSNGQAVSALTDHIFTPTHIPDIAAAIDLLLKSGQKNDTFHVVGSQSLTPFEAAKLIAIHFGYDDKLVTSVTREDFFAGRAERPFNLSLKNDKIGKLGASFKTFEQGLQALSS